MKTCGIIIAKENSNRFKGKNYYNFNGSPLFYHSVELMAKDINLNDIYVATNSEKILLYCSALCINVIFRSINVSRDEEPYFNVLKYAYQCINQKYDAIVSVLANSIDHDKNAIKNGLEILKKDKHVEEIRSFDEKGNQSGIFIFRESVFIKDCMILNHSAAIKSNGREIHFKKELE